MPRRMSSKILVIGEINLGEQHHAENLPRLDEVAQIRAGIVSRGYARRLRIDRGRIAGVAGIAQIEPPGPRIGKTMASGARRQHAIEHVDAAPHGPPKGRPGCQRP
jgi:hypothetical protein